MRSSCSKSHFPLTALLFVSAAATHKSGPTILKTPQTSASSKSAPSTPRPTTITTPGQQPRRVSLTTLNDMLSENSTKSDNVSLEVRSEHKKSHKGVESGHKGDEKAQTIIKRVTKNVSDNGALHSPKSDVAKLSGINNKMLSPKSKAHTHNGLDNNKDLAQSKFNPVNKGANQAHHEVNRASKAKSVESEASQGKLVNRESDDKRKKKSKKHKLIDAENLLNDVSPAAAKKSKQSADFTKPLTVITKSDSMSATQQHKKPQHQVCLIYSLLH